MKTYHLISDFSLRENERRKRSFEKFIEYLKNIQNLIFPIPPRFRHSQDTFARYSRVKIHNVTKEEEEEEEAKIRNCSKPRGNESGGVVKWYSDPFNTRPDLHSVPYELSSRLHPQPRTIKRLILGGCRAHKVLRWFERDYPQLLTYIPPAAILGGWRTHW